MCSSVYLPTLTALATAVPPDLFFMLPLIRAILGPETVPIPYSLSSVPDVDGMN